MAWLALRSLLIGIYSFTSTGDGLTSDDALAGCSADIQRDDLGDGDSTEVSSALLQKQQVRAKLVVPQANETAYNFTAFGFGLNGGPFIALMDHEESLEELPLTEDGWKKATECCCEIEADKFIRRLLMEDGMEICNEGCHNGWMPFQSCQKGYTLSQLRANIRLNTVERCNCYAMDGKCQAWPEDCNSGVDPRPKMGQHRRRRCKMSTTTTTTVEMPITPLGCPKKYCVDGAIQPSFSTSSAGSDRTCRTNYKSICVYDHCVAGSGALNTGDLIFSNCDAGCSIQDCHSRCSANADCKWFSYSLGLVQFSWRNYCKLHFTEFEGPDGVVETAKSSHWMACVMNP